MNRSLFTLLLGLAAPLAETCAQVSVPVNPKATYLGIANDAGALPAPGIPLSALGLAPGAWVHIATTGAYRYNGSSDTQRNLIAVFSSTPQLLTPVNGLVNRVPGAIPVVHGAPITTGITASLGQPTNIAEDFVVGRTGWSDSAVVQVPAGAVYVFLSVFGSSTTNSFGGNSDPNNDYFAVFTPVAPATLQGTAEHCELRTGVGATPSTTPDVKPAAPFATVAVECAQRYGMSTGELFLIAANVYSTGNAPPVGPLPDFHVGIDALIVQVGVMTAAPGLWSLFAPPGHPGTTIVVQGFFLAPSAHNGLLSASDAHRIELQ
ncbi:MAG: hypothetical protein H6835_06945 [Planctomycetes bacterium]|nr:hypothetical protein [Planctomycetota bacterium]